MTDIVRISPRAVQALAQQLDATGSAVTGAARIDVPREIYAQPYVDDSLARIERAACAAGSQAVVLASDIDRFVAETAATDGLVSDRFAAQEWRA